MRANGATRRRPSVRVRQSVARGTASMLQGTKENNANILFDEAPTLIEIAGTANCVGELRTATSNA